MEMNNVIINFSAVNMLFDALFLSQIFPYNHMQVLNRPKHTGLFNFTSQFHHYKEIMYKPDLKHQIRGKPVIFDMDMSPGDFVALLCLLKAPIQAIDLRVSIICANLPF
jgi:hypothetical protein